MRLQSVLIPLALIALSAPALAQQRTAATATTGPDIVVTGLPMKDSAAALRACIARHCPPQEDIAATLAHAENQFVAGDYHAARSTLGRSLGRNRRYAKTLPVEVAGLLRANGTVAVHLGEGDSYRISSIDAVSALKAGLPADDARVLAAQVEVGDSLARTDRRLEAASMYDKVAKRAAARGLTTVEGYARLRKAAMFVAMAETNPDIFGISARDAIDVIADNPDPKMANFVFAARVLRARMAAKTGDTSAIDALIAGYQGGKNRDLILLSAPGVKFPQRAHRTYDDVSGGSLGRGVPMATIESPLLDRATDNFEKQWIDVAFFVAPSGKVTDAGVLRQSRSVSGDWAGRVVTSVAGRRYAPLALDPSDPGFYRIERFTFTSFWTENTGSRLRQRDVNPQIETIDLTPDAPQIAAR